MSEAPWIVTKAEFAEVLGVSRPRVSKLVSDGRLGAGLRSDGRIDVVVAARNAGYPVPRRPGHAQADAGDADDVPERSGGPPDVDPDGDDGEADIFTAADPLPVAAGDAATADPVSLAMQDARLRRLLQQARQAELETAEREGSLVDRVTVDREVEAKARRFRDVMLGVPAQLGEACARLTDPVAVEAAIEAAIEAALVELSREGDDAV